MSTKVLEELVGLPVVDTTPANQIKEEVIEGRNTCTCMYRKVEVHRRYPFKFILLPSESGVPTCELTHCVTDGLGEVCSNLSEVRQKTPSHEPRGRRNFGGLLLFLSTPRQTIPISATKLTNSRDWLL